MSNSSIQSIIFDRSFWTLQEAKAWLKKHNLKDDVDVKPNTYRFRQKKIQIQNTTTLHILCLINITEDQN